MQCLVEVALHLGWYFLQDLKTSRMCIFREKHLVAEWGVFFIWINVFLFGKIATRIGVVWARHIKIRPIIA